MGGLARGRRAEQYSCLGQDILPAITGAAELEMAEPPPAATLAHLAGISPSPLCSNY